MKYPNGFLIISLAVFGAYFVRCAHAAQNAPTPFSSSGLIQSVNKYSSNPFWNPDSPYNQRMPVPVYATGADLNTGDCNRVVENLIVSYCASHNYCVDSRLNDIRPNIMVQLSQLPGHNFATSCGGYIDSIFEKYQKNRGNVSTGIVHYTTTPTVTSTNTVQYENPFKVTPNEYQSGVAERAAELESLQRVTTASPELTPTYFPKTTADLSFTDRLANTTAGYEPYKDLNPYKTPQFESDAEYYERLKKLNTAEYCKRFPNDDETCKKLAEHDITYVAFGGDVSACPTKYDSRKGLTVACVPTRAKSAFVGWCSDSGLQNCAMTQTIAVNDNDDKTFWAKWECERPEYVQTQTACIDPTQPTPNPNPSPNPSPNPNPNPSPNPNPNPNCSDPLYMDANCKCTNIPNTHEDSGTHKCVCDNGNDIADGCDTESEFIIADCRARQLRSHLIPKRNSYLAVVADVDSFNTYCINRKEASEKTSACISHCIKNPDDEPNGGAASNLFQEVTGLPMCRIAGDPIMSTNIRGQGNVFKMTKQKMNEFIKTLKTKHTDSYGNDLQSACKRGNRTSWVLLIDKLKNGRTSIPYATVCIGGAECTTGDVTWH